MAHTLHPFKSHWQIYVGEFVQGTSQYDRKVYPASFAGKVLAVYDAGLLIQQSRTRLWINAVDITQHHVTLQFPYLAPSARVPRIPPDAMNPLRHLARMLG